MFCLTKFNILIYRGVFVVLKSRPCETNIRIGEVNRKNIQPYFGFCRSFTTNDC